MAPHAPEGVPNPRVSLRLVYGTARLLFRLMYGDVRIQVTREMWGTGEPYYFASMPGTAARGIGPTPEHAVGQLVADWGRMLLGLTVDRPP